MSVAGVAKQTPARRARDQVGRAQEIEEPLARDPAPAIDDLVLHEGDVGGRPAEADQPELEEDAPDLGEPGGDYLNLGMTFSAKRRIDSRAVWSPKPPKFIQQITCVRPSSSRSMASRSITRSASPNSTTSRARKS